MAIYTPGVKFRNSKILSKKGGKRNVVAVLSLTAMVDMFTVLVVFLLQNYGADQPVIFVPKGVTLPTAESTRELKPSLVVTITVDDILLEKTPLMRTADLKAQEDWNSPLMQEPLKAALLGAKEKYESTLRNQLQKALNNTKVEEPSWGNITVQADKGVDVLTVKKVLFNLIESGAAKVNFAVTRETEKLTK